MTTMSRPFFHKLVLSSTVHDRKLRIPESFVKKFRGELSAVATLIVPDGRVWRIGLEGADNKFWFRDGWQAFVEYYTICVGFFLVFRYEGSSTFSVFIYNLTSSEINYRSNALSSTGEPNRGKNNNVFEEMVDDDSAENLGFSPPCPTPNSLNNKVFDKRVAGQQTHNKSFNPPPLQNLFSGSNYQNCVIMPNEGDVKLNSSGEDGQVIKKTIRKKRKIDHDKQESSAQQEEEVEMRFRFYESASARRRTVTAEERERALNAAKMFEPSNPFCRVVLRPSYLYRGCIMYLPSCFAEKNLNGVSGFIKLQLSDGKQWPVRCLYRGGRAKLSQGWYEFSLENNLGEGDVCVFELLKMKEVVLKVTIFRVIQDAGFTNQRMQQNVPILLVEKFAQVNNTNLEKFAQVNNTNLEKFVQVNNTNLNSIYMQNLN